MVKTTSFGVSVQFGTDYTCTSKGRKEGGEEEIKMDKMKTEGGGMERWEGRENGIGKGST